MESRNPFGLCDKLLLITGASSGIGKAIAEESARHGAKLILMGRNKSRLENLVSNLEGEGHVYFAGDINNSDYISDLADRINALDGLVFCAGIMELIPLKFATDESISSMANTNYLSPLKLLRNLVKARKLKKRSSVVFVTSINGGVVGSKANSIYGSTKAALTGLCRALCLDFGSKGIRFNCIAPGMIETEGIRNVVDDVSQSEIEKDKMRYPLKRYGRPLDVAYASIYLLSEASSWVTGTTLVVDGGYTAQ